MSTLTIDRVFSNATTNPYDEIVWNKRNVTITDDKNKPIFEQKDVEVPASWSELAIKIVASKYFYGAHKTPERENSVRSLIHRVANTLRTWGVESGYFSEESGQVFYDELSYICLNQYGAFNSPVWFNVGLWHEYKAGANGTSGGWAYNYETGQVEKQTLPYLRPQGSACFIQSVDDNMDSIMSLATSEAMLFKFGSGTGTDLTTLRSSKEKLSGGGTPSGPLSFLRVYDQVANTVKSGGKTRRAAKMNTLRDWHPDIEEFIVAKMREEKKAHALIDAGYDGSFNGESYATVAFQNENLSVRVSDDFMAAAARGDKWKTYAVTTGQVVEEKDASKLLDLIAEGTWVCGDPGLQYDGAIQRWHTCKATEEIHSTNPCSEYIFINNTACNLASLNLLKFRTDEGFDIEKFKAAVRIFIIAQEILVDSASYPTKMIAENSHIFRTLGLGYANLGSLIMSLGLPYDSHEGNTIAGSIAALMTGEAYAISAEMAQIKGPFPGYLDARCSHVKKPKSDSNRESMLEVIRAHCSNAEKIKADKLPKNLASIAASARNSWTKAYDMGLDYGYRNAQVTVVAPTGTIAFMMDCDTTGIEPDTALVKYKNLAGGGSLKIVNNTVPFALQELGYSSGEITKISAYIMEHDTIEDTEGKTSGLKPEHLPVFDCAFKPAKGVRSIPWMAHLNVMAAVQPFISGAISKTVNMPGDATVADIRGAYVEAWKLGLKCVAIYRDGSKRSQPLNTSKTTDTPDISVLKALDAKVAELEAKLKEVSTNKENGPYRERLTDTRRAVTHKFNVGGQEGYVTVGIYDDGRPGELFVQMSKEGSTMGGLMDTIGTLTSISLQYGVPLETLVEKFSHQRFEPHGYTSNPKIRTASSIIDYIFRWMKDEFANNKLSTKSFDVAADYKPVLVQTVTSEFDTATKSGKSGSYKSGQCCGVCGSSSVQISGTCATCTNCGTSLGCS